MPTYDSGTGLYYYGPRNPWGAYSTERRVRRMRLGWKVYGTHSWRVCQCGAGTENVRCGVCGR